MGTVRFGVLSTARIGVQKVIPALKRGRLTDVVAIASRDPERAAIVQCYHNDLSHEEAAQVLGCPVGTVKTHILRAKQKLKARLGAWSPQA